MPVKPEPFARGTTFSFALAIPEQLEDGFFKNWVPAAQIRKARNDQPNGLIAKLACFWADPETTRVLIVHMLNTSHWPTGPAEMDILLRSVTGEVLRSTIQPFNIHRGITK